MTDELIAQKPCPLMRLAEHLTARPKQFGCDEIAQVADWLDHSLNRCGLVVVDEQRLAALSPPAETGDDEMVARAIYEALFDADNGVKDCGPLISKRHAALAAEAVLEALSRKGRK